MPKTSVTNPISALFRGMGDNEIKKAVAELIEKEETGVLPQGVVRDTAHRLMAEFGIVSQDARSITDLWFYKEAALRWAVD